MGVNSHRRQSLQGLGVGVFSISSTRTLSNDESGHWICSQVERNGHVVACHRILPDDARIIREAVLSFIGSDLPDALLMTGGTGSARKDVTIEAVQPLFQKELVGFQVLFTQLSFQEVGAAAMLSRATAGIIRETAVFCMPGSLNACRLACDRLIFPELGHLLKHLKSG